MNPPHEMNEMKWDDQGFVLFFCFFVIDWLTTGIVHELINATQYLLEKGANPRVSDWSGKTALQSVTSSFFPNEAATQLLMEALSKPSTTTGKHPPLLLNHTHNAAEIFNIICCLCTATTTLCKVCAAPSTQRCSQCKSAAYCSRDCQRKYVWERAESREFAPERERERFSSFPLMRTDWWIDWMLRWNSTHTDWENLSPPKKKTGIGQATRWFVRSEEMLPLPSRWWGESVNECEATHVWNRMESGGGGVK